MLVLNPPSATGCRAHHGVATPRPRCSTSASRAHQLESRCVRSGVLVAQGRATSTAWPAAPAHRRPAPWRWRAPPAPDVVVSHVSAGRIWGLRRLGRGRLGCTSTIDGRSNRRRARTWSSTAPIGSTPSTSSSAPTASASRARRGRRSTSRPSLRDDAARVDHRAAPPRRPLHAADAVRHGRPAAPSAAATARPASAGCLHSRPSVARSRWPATSSCGSSRRSSPPASRGRSASTRSARRPARSSTPTSTGPTSARSLEVDHVTWHGGKLDLTYDKRRDRAAVAARHPRHPRHGRRDPPSAARGRRRHRGDPAISRGLTPQRPAQPRQYAEAVSRLGRCGRPSRGRGARA